MKQYMICDVNISKNIVRLRKKARMTQKYVSNQLEMMGLKMCRSRLSMIELNRLNVPVSILVGMKIIFQCEYADFFEGLEEMLPLDIAENEED